MLEELPDRKGGGSGFETASVSWLKTEDDPESPSMDGLIYSIRSLATYLDGEGFSNFKV